MLQHVLLIVHLDGIKIPEIVSVLLVLVNVRHVMVQQNINANDKPKELRNISNDYMYELSAVVTHKGYKSTETGHYVADIFR